MKKTVFALLVSIILPTYPVEARPISPIDGLESLRKSFAAINDFTADIVQEKQLSIMKKKLISTGTVRFRKPGLFFMELNPPHASRLLLNDNKLTLYLPKEKSVSNIQLPPDQSLNRWFVYLEKPVTALPEGVGVKADQQGDTLTLNITPASGGQVKEFIVTLQADGVIKKLVIVEQSGDKTMITFNKMRRNMGLKDKDFIIE